MDKAQIVLYNMANIVSEQLEYDEEGEDEMEEGEEEMEEGAQAAEQVVETEAAPVIPVVQQVVEDPPQDQKASEVLFEHENK